MTATTLNRICREEGLLAGGKVPMTEKDVTSVEIGEEVEVYYPGYRPHTVKEKAQAPCRDAHNGHWYCVTHRLHCSNQFHKDTHITRGKHKLAWVCYQHGLEAP